MRGAFKKGRTSSSRARRAFSLPCETVFLPYIELAANSLGGSVVPVPVGAQRMRSKGVQDGEEGCEGRKTERKENEEQERTGAGAARQELDYKLLGSLKRTISLHLLVFLHRILRNNAAFVGNKASSSWPTYHMEVQLRHGMLHPAAVFPMIARSFDCRGSFFVDTVITVNTNL